MSRARVRMRLLRKYSHTQHVLHHTHAPSAARARRSNLSEVLCKPKIMPIKSITLEKLEQMEAQAAAHAALPATSSNKSSM